MHTENDQDIKSEEAVVNDNKVEVLLEEKEKHSKPLEECQKKIEELEKIQQEYKENALRAMAEAENIKKRTEKEIQEIKKYALSAFIESLVPVVENLYRSTEHILEEHRANISVKKIVEGIEMTQSEFMKLLERQGIKRVMPAVGEDFNPNLHQAISMISNSEIKKNSIHNIIEAGYTINERLIKPALVVVNN